jgi:methionine-rich copper-binding protein CopC
LAIGLLVLAQGPASAHAELESSQPQDGAVLKGQPAQVIAHFSTELETSGSAMTLIDANGRPVASASGGVDLDDPDHASMVIIIAPQLPAGRYVVKWTATSTADGHVGHATGGEFKFELR